MSRSLRLLFILLFAHACAPPPAVAAGPGPASLTFCVVDESASYGQVTTRAGGVTIRTNSGERACKPLFGETGRVAVDVRSIGGGMRGPLRWRDTFVPNVGTRCYLLVVKNVEAGMNVVPCDFYRGRDAAAAMTNAAQDTLPRGYQRLVIGEDWDAYTTCATRPKSWFGHEIRPEQRAMIEVHEEEHRRHMAEFGTCEAWYAWRNASVANRVEAEARAFCAGARYEYEQGQHASLEAAIWSHAFHMLWYFGIPQDHAAWWIRRACARAT
jgi:hypothetical protein